MSFGLSDSQFEDITEVLFRPVTQHGAKTWVFGSRARGDHSEFSDLDVLIEAGDDLKPVVSKISEELENGSFPFKVDIVFAQDLADSYRDSVDAEKVHVEVDDAP